MIILYNFALPNLKNLNFMPAIGSITKADYLPYEEYRRLVNNLMKEKKYWWACYCVLSFCTALRYSDVCRLRWSDVLDQRRIIIQAKKTGKRHIIPIGVHAEESLKSLYEKLGSPDKQQLILKTSNPDKPHAAIQYINRVLKNWKYKYELNIDNFSTHTFRKTFGRYVYEKDGCSEKSLMFLNHIFDHANLSTTRIYLGIRDEEIADIFDSLII